VSLAEKVEEFVVVGVTLFAYFEADLLFEFLSFFLYGLHQIEI